MKIKELRLYTKNLEGQVEFYTGVLNLAIAEMTPSSVSFKIGDSLLIFESREEFTCYHLAFNIPSNREIEALEWLGKRVNIIPFEGNEVIDFKNWNAKSIYFYDADSNIIEFIARKDLELKSLEEFSSTSILSMSEVGIGTANIRKVYKDIAALRPIPIFDGNFDKFCALGNHEGLFIIANLKYKTWFPSDDKIYPSEFQIRGDYNFDYKNGKIIEIV
jgi:catechol 2,3-dioxygenase-like lactoylglutathione lyase family enzyme